MSPIFVALVTLCFAAPAWASMVDLSGLLLFLGIGLLIFLMALVAFAGNVVLLIKGSRSQTWARLGIVSGALCVVLAVFVYSTCDRGRKPPDIATLVFVGVGLFNIICGLTRK